MREIKFKAIYRLCNGKESLSKAFTLSEIQSYESERCGKELFVEGKRGEEVYISSDTKLIQFTGVKDKDEKDIYEGDIIHYCGSSWEVRYSERAARFFLTKNNGKRDNNLSQASRRQMEIIGNVIIKNKTTQSKPSTEKVE